MILAIGPEGQLGLDNRLLWHLPQDLQYFKKITLNKTVIMGRNTFDSIFAILKRPLPQRRNIVITHRPLENIETSRSLEEAIALALSASHSDNIEVMIIGGGQIYREALQKNLVDRIYLTRVLPHVYNGPADTYFNMDDLKRFNRVSIEKTADCHFEVLTKDSSQ